MRDRLHFGPRIGRRDAEAHAAHHHDVGEIVADVGHFLGRDLGVGQNFFEDRNLLGVPLIDVLNLHCVARSTVAGETRPLIRPVAMPSSRHPLQRDAVLRIEALGLRHLAVRRRARCTACRR